MDPRRSETRGEITRLNQRNIDSKPLHLGAQRLRKALYGKFGARIEPLIGNPLYPRNRTEIDNVPPALLPHIGQHLLAHVHAAVKVGLHLVSYFVPSRGLQGPAYAESCIVDEYVYPPLAGNYLFYNAPYPLHVFDVSLEKCDLGVLVFAAANPIHPVTLLAEQFGCGLAKSRRRSGYDDDFLHGSLFLFCKGTFFF